MWVGGVCRNHRHENRKDDDVGGIQEHSISLDMKHLNPSLLEEKNTSFLGINVLFISQEV